MRLWKHHLSEHTMRLDIHFCRAGLKTAKAQRGVKGVRRHGIARLWKASNDLLVHQHSDSQANSGVWVEKEVADEAGEAGNWKEEMEQQNKVYKARRNMNEGMKELENQKTKLIA
jgi:hypothetical protein